MSSSYNYYRNTLNEIAGKIKLATEAFSGKSGNYCAIPQYNHEKKILIVRVKNLTDKSNFAIFQKLGRTFGIKCYDCKDRELYEYIQTIDGDKKSSYLYYDIANRIGIIENSSRDSVDNKFYPTKIEENVNFGDSKVVNYTNTLTPVINDSISYVTTTNRPDVNDWPAEERSQKSIDLVGFYYLLNSNSIRDNICEFNKTFKDFIINNTHSFDTSNKDINKNFPEDR